MAEEDKDTIDFGADAGKGFEDMTQQDFSMPLLNILQAGSPELLEGNEKYNPEARPGRIYNTATQQIYRECTVLPVRFKSKFVEWKPRSQGGGFVDHYGVDTLPPDTTPDPLTGILHRANGNDVLQTDYYLCMLKEENWSKVIIALKATQLKKARKWNSLMFSQRATDAQGRGYSLPFFSTLYKLSVSAESNAKGNWYGWKVELIGRITDPQLYNSAKEVFQTQIDFLPQRLLAMKTTEEGEPIDENKTDKDPF